MNKKIVVTGGGGFIGSHVVRLLCDKGFDVWVVDDLSFGFEKFIDKRARFVKERIQNEKPMDKVLPEALAVIHLAASSIIKFSYKHPLEYFQNNFIDGIKLLEAMRKNKVKKIIFSSTASVYGIPKRIPVLEKDGKNPLNSYGSSKLAFEYALESYFHSFGIESVSLRYFNAYGPNDEQKPATRAVPIWTRALLKNQPIPLYWKGKQKRDYVYVEDIANAHLLALKLSGLHFINIGSGEGIVMKEILKLLEKLTERKAKTSDKGQRLGDPANLVADISLAKKILKWSPKTKLEEGLKKTIEYYKKNL